LGLTRFLIFLRQSFFHHQGYTLLLKYGGTSLSAAHAPGKLGLYQQLLESLQKSGFCRPALQWAAQGDLVLPLFRNDFLRIQAPPIWD
jgi:hypothetical protein